MVKDEGSQRLWPHHFSIVFSQLRRLASFDITLLKENLHTLLKGSLTLKHLALMRHHRAYAKCMAEEGPC